jgi:uncharacterized membrane protein YdbT with pleckstrin-like domain
MGYMQSTLLPSERLLYRAHLHWIVFGRALLCTTVGLWLLLSGAAPGVSALGGFLLLVLALPALVSAMLTYQTSEFGVTTKRVLMKTGFIRRRTLELQLAQAESIAIEQSILGRLLDYGTVILTGTGGAREGKG